MQLELLYSANDGFVPLDYRPFIMSNFKGPLSNLYSGVFDELYSRDKIKPKSFTFSVYFQNAKIEKEKIIIPSKKFKVTLSSYDSATVLFFYNSMLLKLNQTSKIPMKTTITLNGLSLKDIPDIEKDEVKIKFLSPLLVRDKNEESELYLDYKSQEFEEKLNIITKNFIDTLSDNDFSSNEIELIPLEAKQTVVKNMKLLFNASYGTYLLKGDHKLLTILQNSGMGSRRGEGFGMFKVIE